MNCEEAQRLIDEAAASVEMAAHIEGCPDCRAYADQNGRLESLVRESSVAVSSAPEKLVQQAMEQVRAGRARRRALWIGIGSTAVAAAVFVFAVVVGFGRPPAKKGPLAEVPAKRRVAEKPKRKASIVAETSRKKVNSTAAAKPQATPAPEQPDPLDLLDRIVELTLAVSDAESDAERLPLYHTMAGELVGAYGQPGAADAELTQQYVKILEDLAPLVARLRLEGQTEAFGALHDGAREFERTLKSAGPQSDVGAALAVTRAYREALNTERSQG